MLSATLLMRSDLRCNLFTALSNAFTNAVDATRRVRLAAGRPTLTVRDLASTHYDLLQRAVVYLKV
jgi:hypothetical protein